VIERAIESVASAISASFVEASRSDHPLQGETFRSLIETLNAIAQTIEDHKGE
jgi:hypothetical protein